jgi:hypothetical protein
VATEPSDALEDVSENMMSLFDNYMHSNAHSSEERPIPTDQYGPMIESPSEEEVKPTTSSSLASSFSWGSTGSSKPPTCPSSSDTRRRLPTKPTTKSKIKSKLSKKNKRRLKKLTGLLPSMMDADEDEEDIISDDDGGTGREGGDDCPADLL